MNEGQLQALISWVLDEGHWQTELWREATVSQSSVDQGTCFALQGSSCPSHRWAPEKCQGLGQTT